MACWRGRAAARRRVERQRGGGMTRHCGERWSYGAMVKLQGCKCTQLANAESGFAHDREASSLPGEHISRICLE